MTVPLTLTNVYVQVRLHAEARAGYEIDPALQAAEGRHDPNMLFQVGRKYLESRAGAAMEPAEAIAKAMDKRCVIVGDPGAGKTTLLKRLALQAAGQELAGLPDLPIHIELNAFAGSGFSDLLAFAAHTWQQRYSFAEDEIYGYVKERLTRGQALLLLDALDETVIGENVEAAEASYKRAAEAIMQLASRYPHAPLVVTARKAGYHERTRLVGFSELEVLDFSPKDITEFVSNWFEHHPSPKKHATADDLNARLERSPRISALAANPLLLSLIVIVYEDNLDLPDRRSELYRQCVETLLTRWDTSRDIVRRRQFKPEQKQQLLEDVAWHFHRQGLRYFPTSELLAIIEDFLPTVGLPPAQSNVILSEIAAESGLLKEQAQDWYGFLHLTLQEYFAARCAIAQNELETLLRHVGDPWWEEVLLLYAGGARDAGPLLERRLDAAQDDIFSTNLVMAGRCLAARPTIRHTALRSEIPSRLFDTLLDTPYSLTRQYTAGTLAEVGRSAENVNTRLLGLLANEKIDFGVRVSLAKAIGQYGERSLADKLLRLFADEQIQVNLARAIGQYGKLSLADKKLLLLDDEQTDWLLKENFAWALGMLGNRAIVPDLLALINSRRTSEDTRRRAAIALSKLADRSLAPHLLSLLLDSRLDDTTRWSIYHILAAVADTSLAPDLLALLSDSSAGPLVTSSAACILRKLGHAAAIDILLAQLARHDLSGTMQTIIILDLISIDEPFMLEKLLSLLADPQIHEGARAEIVLALGRRGDTSILAQLRHMRANEGTAKDIYLCITVAIKMLGDTSVEAELVEALARGDISWPLEEYAAEALDVSTRLKLLAAARANSSLRNQIAESFEKTSRVEQAQVIPELRRLLLEKRTHPDVRQSIARALGTLVDDEETVRMLAPLVLDEEIADEMHEALWAMSRRAGVRVIWAGLPGEGVQVVRDLDPSGSP